MALVGFRKVMDYIPSVFSQRDLFWLDNLMPESKHTKAKKQKKKRKNWYSFKKDVVVTGDGEEGTKEVL